MISTSSNPARVAAAVLDAMLDQPDAFNMTSWIDADGPLAPDEDPDCGTTMCVAGWTAHLTGWTIYGDTATKAGDCRRIEDVGREALGLTHEAATALFNSGPFTAIATLTRLAGRPANTPKATTARTRRHELLLAATHQHGLAHDTAHPHGEPLTSRPHPADDPVLTGELVDQRAIYLCRACHNEYAYSVVAGHIAPVRMPHEDCPASRTSGGRA